MAHFGATFDATAVEPSKPIELLPPERYVVQIVASEMRATKDGQGQYLWLELDVLEGEFQGRKLFDRLNLVNSNPTTVEIAQRTLSAICHATGRMQVQDSEELHLVPMMADVRVQPSKTEGYGPANTLRYLPLERPGEPPAVAPTRAAISAKSSAPAPVARPTGPTPPWRKSA
ncbi:MAG: DUF669 domain-containing protein [Rhodospirillales bacterium]|nr:DUF669 domain-containing protein [Rhodospirillales bacterium]